MPDSNDKEVRYDILVEARAAIKAIKELDSVASSADKSLSRLRASASSFKESANSWSRENKKVEESTKKVKASVDDAGKSLFTFKNLLKTGITALGIRALFNALEAIQNIIKSAIELVRDLEISMSKLATAEKSLSEAGIVVQMEDLLQIVTDIGTHFRAFSDADIKQAVSNAALLTKEFGFTVDQIRQATEAGAALALRTPGESIEGATEKLLSGLTSGKFVALRNMGVGIDAVSVQARALADTGKKLVGQLTTQDKAVATLALVYESLADEIENVDDKLNTLDGRLRETNAASENVKTTLGTLFAPFIASFAPFLNKLDSGLLMVKVWTVQVLAQFALIGVAWELLWSRNIKNLDDFNKASEVAVKEIMDNLVNQFFSAVPDEAPDFLDEFFSHIDQFEDTPTGEVEEFTASLEDLADVDLDDLADDLAKLNQRIDELNATFERTETRKHEDYLLDKARAEQDYANDVADINQDAATSRAEAEQDFRENEIQAESDYQDDLRKLREQFLFSLEDALRERDARQVLRLTRKFEMDKNNLSTEYDAERAERERQHQQDMADISRRQQERLAEAAREQQIRMQRMAEDEAIRAQRASEDHQRELAELEAQIARRLEEEAAAIAAELELRADGAEAILDVLTAYYGPGGAFDSLFAYSARAQVAQYEAMLSSIMAIQAQAAAITADPLFGKDPNLPSGYVPSSSTPSLFSKDANLPSGYIPSIGAQADGGTYFANKPTHAIFGEAGAEIATFTPANEVQSRASNGDVGGNLHVMLELSPDLEGRIVSKSMDKVSATIERVRRE